MTIGGNLPPGYYALLFSISSTGSFICPGVQPRLDLPRPLITQSYGVFTPEQDNDETNVEPVHSYDAFHTWFVGPGVKGIIGMRRFNICLVVVLSLSCRCLVVVLLWCENTIRLLGESQTTRQIRTADPSVHSRSCQPDHDDSPVGGSNIHRGPQQGDLLPNGGGLYIYNIYACSKYS